MGKKVITPIIAFIGLFIISSAFAQQNVQVKPAPQQKPAEKFIQKAAPSQTASKIPTIDASMLQRLRTPLSRPTLINTLMGNQVTRSTLESYARNAKIQVKELPTKGLDGKPITNAPQGKKIEELNWGAGIPFSLVRFNPKFFDPTDNKEKPLGDVKVFGIFLESGSVSQAISMDAFQVNAGQAGGSISLALLLPPYRSSYMIAMQGYPTSGTEMTIVDSNNLRKLDMVPFAGGEGSAALADITPLIISKSVGRCDIFFKPGPGGLIFGIFVITRL